MKEDRNLFSWLLLSVLTLLLLGCAPKGQGFLTKQYVSPYAPYYSTLPPFYQNYYAPRRYKYYYYSPHKHFKYRKYHHHHRHSR